VIISELKNDEIMLKMPNFQNLTSMNSLKLKATAIGGASRESGEIRIKQKNCDNKVA